MFTSSSIVCMENQRKTFGQLLKAARERKGISQPVLASRVKVSPMMISRYERDLVGAPDADIVMKLIGALELESPEALGFTGGRDRVFRPRVVTPGPASAREAVLDAEHYLQYLFKRAGIVSEDQQLTAAAKLDERFPQWSTVTPALVDLWLENYDSKRGRR
jgi:transcriptional regulator with XRE-family HTH domain